jgi:hypothetical protein
MHAEIIDTGTLANLMQRCEVKHRDDLEGLTLYRFDLAGRDVRVVSGNSDDAVLFCATADATHVLNAISKPLPQLAIVDTSTTHAN